MAGEESVARTLPFGLPRLRTAQFPPAGATGHGADIALRPLMTQCMVRPCVARRFRRVGGLGAPGQLIAGGVGARPDHYWRQMCSGNLDAARSRCRRSYVDSGVVETDDSTRVIVSAIDCRNELCTDCVIRNGDRRYRCPTVSTLVRTRPLSCTPVYWTFVGRLALNLG